MTLPSALVMAAGLVLVWPGSAAATSPTPTDVTEGTLLAREGKRLVHVPLRHTDVRLRVVGHLVDATVTQRFVNPYDDKIEAVYLFPLPTGAAVNAMELVSGGRRIQGRIERRAQARRVYERARQRGEVAALLAQERPNVFTQAVANLEPGAEVRIEIHYVQPLVQDDGGYELVFPMVVGPRYLPSAHGAVGPPAVPPDVRSSHEIAVRVDLDAGVPLGPVTSPSHRLAITPGADGRRAAIGLAAGDTVPNKDFVLRWRVAGPGDRPGEPAKPAFAVLAHRAGDGAGSFFLTAQPPAAAGDAAIAPRELIFVLDTSSSMKGRPLTKGRELIRRALTTLRPDDTFQIVRFADTASALGPRPIANRANNIALALGWLDRLRAGGGTEVATGIATALAVPHDPARLRVVVFVTDGFVGNEDEILARAAAQLGSARLFSFGVGSAVNRYLLEELAALGRGDVQVVRPDEDTGAAVARFARRIDRAVLTDITIDWGQLAVADVTPAAVPDLFVGQPLVIAGHYTRPGAGTITVRGTRAGRPIAFTVPVALPAAADRPAVATVWARARIAELSRKLVRAPDASIERAIVDLALAHRLLTRFTSFVAVDASRTTRGGPARTVAVPVEVPDGVETALGGGGSGTGIGYAYGAIGLGQSTTIVGYGAGVGVGGGGATGGMHGRSFAMPSVKLGQPMVLGSLDKAIVRRYLKRHFAKLQYCYEKRLLQKPTLDGTVETQFTIGATGHVIAATASGMDSEVADCVKQVIENIEYPQATGGGVVVVHYPFTFQRI